MSKNDSYRILKLRSGEQLITSMKGQNGSKYLLERPMIFERMSVYDAYGQPKQVTVLKDWLSFTNEIQTKIPKDHVASFLKPAQEAINLYEYEKEKLDVLPPNTTIKKYPMTPPPSNGDSTLEDDMKIMDLFDKLTRAQKGKNDKEPINLNDEFPEEAFDSLEDREEDITDMKNFVSMTLFFPPEVLLTLVEDGIVDETDITELIRYLKGKNSPKSPPYTGDEKDRPDFGNRWTDWQVDLDDYLDEDN